MVKVSSFKKEEKDLPAIVVDVIHELNNELDAVFPSVAFCINHFAEIKWILELEKILIFCLKDSEAFLHYLPYLRCNRYIELQILRENNENFSTKINEERFHFHCLIMSASSFCNMS